VLFPTYTFIFVFLPLTLVAAFLLGGWRHRAAVLALAVASLVFYGAWDWRFVPLLLASIAFNFGAGVVIARRRAAGAPTRALLAAAIAANLALLALFKYANFFLGAVGAGTVLHLVLPLGISFFTFTQVAFLVDVHRGEAAEYRFPEYLLFVTWFPHLIAGPLLHHAQLVPQLQRAGAFRPDMANIAAGLSIFIVGLAKKVLVADPLSAFANPVFDAAAEGAEPRFAESWMGALAYTLQLYFDFSGYSDMAIGISLMFNIRLPLNFDSPYKAASIIDFWRRWHMTLSAFLRDYLYIPLGGSRKGVPRRYANLMATMLLGGLWHGAGWTFIAWGALHGFYLVVNHAWRALRARFGLRGGGRASHLLAVLLTFLAVVVGWVLFRAADMDTAGRVLAGMAGLNGWSLPVEADAALRAAAPAWLPGSVVFDGLAPLTRLDGRSVIFAIAAALAIAWFLPNVREWFATARPTWEQAMEGGAVAQPARTAWRPQPRYAIALGATLFLCLAYLGARPAAEFLYYQF
jgi:alginate O-acetyltransferase complex protein AlgI